MHTITQQKQDALLELHQLRKQFVKGKPASVFKARPGDRFPPHRGLFFSAGKEVTRVKVVVRQECNRIWKLLFFLEPKSSQQVCTNFSAVKITLTAATESFLPTYSRFQKIRACGLLMVHFVQRGSLKYRIPKQINHKWVLTFRILISALLHLQNP